jgi:hypothetical protein
MSSEQAPSNDTGRTKDKQGEKPEAGMILAEGPQVTNATAMSHDDTMLEKVVQQRVSPLCFIQQCYDLLTIMQLGYDVRLDKEWTVCENLEKADSSIRALLVRQDCEWGAVRVDSVPVSNVVTGQGNDFYIVYIDTGQSCRFYQQPSVRFFHRL